ncbi:MAG: hypothetical protein H6P99_739 [Holophagaceae bacterium]|nr:hypothetical protein [Holophagaceae bacterium]
MIIPKILPLVLCLSLSAQVNPSKLPPELQATLESRMKRSQEIFEYERLAWVASDLLMEKKPDQRDLGLWVELVANQKRMIFFGRFKDAADPKEKPEGFAVVYGFWAPVGKPSEVHELDIGKEIRSSPEAFKELPDLAEAAALARKHPSSLGMGWNYSVFREPDRTITAYLMPANSEPGIVPIGGDFRLTLAPDGTKILKTVALHRSYLKMPINPPNADKAKPAGGFHTHTLEEDLPPETDAAVLMLYADPHPHYLLTRKGLFCFTGNQVVYLMSPEELKK